MTKTAAPTLAEFELMVLVAAMRLDDDAHAVSIAADIGERTGRLVRRANVYTTLQRLEDKGLVTTAVGDARPERGGKPRRVVTPTRDGVAGQSGPSARICRRLVGRVGNEDHSLGPRRSLFAAP